MENTRMVVRKRTHAEVEYNDGEFTEMQTYGIVGIEKNLLLEKIQFHRCDTPDTPEEFQQRFPVGARVEIVTITHVTTLLGGR